jgi:hypothetical protein
MYLLNNCQSRDHVAHFGEGAFYDLDPNGGQGNLAAIIQPGDICIVATRINIPRLPVAQRHIDFNHYIFRELGAGIPDMDGIPQDVLYGDFQHHFGCLQAEAINIEPYSHFFNVNGHFLMQSVIIF